MDLSPEQRAALIRSARAQLRVGRVWTLLLLWIPLGAFVAVVLVFLVLLIVF